MSVSFSEIMEVKNFLMQQHIVVSEEWTEACISFVKQDRGHAISLQNLKNIVRQQWLVADVEEIACASLPQNLPTVQKITLNNSFALQVEGIRDISRPAYAQLKELEGPRNSNEEFSTDPKTSVPEWEAKPKRVLMLKFTDGCTQIQGMEYRPINFLSPNLRPGIKVLIKGPVDSRFGVLLLTTDNIIILGGEVESKLHQYSRETILKEHLQIQTEDVNPTESSEDSRPVLNNQGLSSHPQISNGNSYLAVSQQNENNPSTSRLQSGMPSRTGITYERNTEDILDHFESDDDFEQIIDLEKLDEIENSQRQADEPMHSEMMEDEGDIWQEDEDVVRDLLEFQDQSIDFEIPFELHDGKSSKNKRNQAQLNEVFTYLSTMTNNPSSNSVITIKGFILTVLSKLECTPSRGWSLTVKINDGTASINASIHDKVLENIIGVSAQDMIKKQVLAAKNADVKREVIQTISKCKLTLQNYNCLMDIKFTPGETPCIVKCSPISELHIQQLFERVRCSY